MWHFEKKKQVIVSKCQKLLSIFFLLKIKKVFFLFPDEYVDPWCAGGKAPPFTCGALMVSSTHFFLRHVKIKNKPLIFFLSFLSLLATRVNYAKAALKFTLSLCQALHTSHRKCNCTANIIFNWRFFFLISWRKLLIYFLKLTLQGYKITTVEIANILISLFSSEWEFLKVCKQVYCIKKKKLVILARARVILKIFFGWCVCNYSTADVAYYGIPNASIL